MKSPAPVDASLEARRLRSVGHPCLTVSHGFLPGGDGVKRSFVPDEQARSDFENLSLMNFQRWNWKPRGWKPPLTVRLEA